MVAPSLSVRKKSSVKPQPKRVICPHCGASVHPSTVSRHIRQAKAPQDPSQLAIPNLSPPVTPNPLQPATPSPSQSAVSSPSQSAIPSPSQSAIPSPSQSAVSSSLQSAVPSPSQPVTPSHSREAIPSPTPSSSHSATPSPSHPPSQPQPPDPSALPAGPSVDLNEESEENQENQEWIDILGDDNRMLPVIERTGLMDEPTTPPLYRQPTLEEFDADTMLKEIADLQAARIRLSAITPESPEFTSIKAYKLQMEINLGHNAFHKLRRTFPELPLPSLKVLHCEMKQLSGGLSFIQSLYANTTSAHMMRYRAEHQDDNLHRSDERISDVYDSKLYRRLRQSYVTVDGKQLDRKYFSDPRDVFVGCMTDGFQVFKRAKHTAWPIILLNMNLDPAIRYQWENVICIGLIPGPKKPKSFNSFMWVYAEEMVQAAQGVPTYDAEADGMFDLHVYGPLGSGDMPAVASALTCTKNHNAKHPCRFCRIEGVPIVNSSNRIHYVPMKRPAGYPANPLTTNNLATIPHDEFITRAKLVDAAPTVKDRQELQQQFGINCTPVLSRLPGICFPYSFPLDFMHLLENLLKNYTKLLSGDFKGIKNGRETYIFSDKVWKEIGTATVTANATIPSSFGRRIPNIAEDRTFFTAEAYVVWFTLYAPILLRNRFSRPKYYKHFSLLINIINRLLSFVSTRAERDILRADIVKWYEEYEDIFYQYDPARLPTCLITVHTWLHLVDLMEQSGPLWGYWCWVMERYCSRLLRAVTSRKHPYTSLNRRILETQTLLAIRNTFNLHDALPRYTLAYDPHTTTGWEAEEDGPYSDIKLHGPRRVIRLDPSEFASLRNRIAVYLMTRNHLSNRASVLSHLPKKISQYTKIQLKDGDTVSSVHGSNRLEENQRLATFCQYELLVDALARNRTVRPVLDGRTFFGELERVFVLRLRQNPAIKQNQDETLVLLDIHSCDTSVDTYNFFEYERHGAREIVDASALRAVVGRIRNGSKWTFVRRPGVFEHATYIYDDEDELEDD
ncbi:hypothetical protein FRC05_006265 [Tulasnella sp. 425]|nr:hypothetical protein FRC05_006265 [Tulasnella sp. 425]